MKEFIKKVYYRYLPHSNQPVAGTAVLDPAHIGDIHGAWGTISKDDHPHYHKGLLKKLLAFLVIMGPGLIVMVGDNDAGGVATYMQAGQNYGTSLLWTLFLLIPVLIVNQEMVARLGAVTGVGHARMIIERFGKFWGFFSAGDLFILNFLTIVTEFIGISMGMAYFGIAPYISVPLFALILIAMTITGSFKRWEQFMYGFIIFSFLIYPLLLMVHPKWTPILHDTFIPGIAGGLNSTALLLIISIVGTTVAPWQLFFQQSNVIDKRITPRWLNHERSDTIAGSFISEFAAAAMIIVTAYAFAGTKLAGKFSDMIGVINGLSAHIGHAAGAMGAIILMDAAVIGAAAVTLSTSYAFGDVFKLRHSLHRSFKDAKSFYLSYSLLVVLAAAIVLIPHAPLGLISLAVQALAGILLPSATVFLVLLCNDKHVLGPWTNSKRLNVIAGIIIGVLIMLSFILAATTIFPVLNGTKVVFWSAITLTIGLCAIGGFYLFGKKKSAGTTKKTITMTVEEKMNWRMQPLEKLPKPEWSTTGKIGMYALRGYLALAAILMVIKVVQLAMGH